jgi:hypothetical protein
MMVKTSINMRTPMKWMMKKRLMKMRNTSTLMGQLRQTISSPKITKLMKMKMMMRRALLKRKKKKGSSSKKGRARVLKVREDN